MFYYVLWVLIVRALLYADVTYVFLAFETVVLIFYAVILAQRKSMDQA